MGRQAKIRLKYTLPMSPEHGMFAGVELVGMYERTREIGVLRSGFWVTAPGSGEDALVFRHECEVIEWIEETDAEGTEEEGTD